MKILKSFFLIGVYDPNIDDAWPWHCHYESGRYLSAKKRVCSRNSSAEFESPEEARLFYHSWKHSDKYKMEVIEVKYWVEAPDPVYPPEHPRSIIERVSTNERFPAGLLAACWFSGQDPLEKMGYSKTTNVRYRKILLKYGIDLFSKPTEEMRKLLEESHPRNFSDFDFRSSPKLKLVKS